MAAKKTVTKKTKKTEEPVVQDVAIVAGNTDILQTKLLSAIAINLKNIAVSLEKIAEK